MRHECFGCCARSARGRPLYIAARARTRIFVGRGREPVTLPETSKCKSGLETWSTTQSTWDPSGSALCPPLPLNISLSTLFSALYLKILQRVHHCSRKDVRVIFQCHLITFLHRFRGGENRETHNTQVCWSGWTNWWKSKNSQQIWSRTTSQRLSKFRSLLIKFFVAWYAFINLDLKCFTWATRWFKGVCRARGAQGGKQFAKSCFFCVLRMQFKSLSIIGNLFLAHPMLFCCLNFALHSVLVEIRQKCSLLTSQYVYKGPQMAYRLRKVFENIYYPR